MDVEIRYPTVAHRRRVAEALSRLRVRPEVAGVVLSGSLARGTARDNSDVDILVVATTLPDSGTHCDLPGSTEALRAQLDLLDVFEPQLSAFHPTATVIERRGRGGR